jgi:hypothetical protein
MPQQSRRQRSQDSALCRSKNWRRVGLASRRVLAHRKSDAPRNRQPVPCNGDLAGQNSRIYPAFPRYPNKLASPREVRSVCLWVSEAMKKLKSLLSAFVLFASGCSWMNGLHVTAYQSVYGAEASPWPSGCLVTIESRTRRYVGLHGEPCAHIAIGDKAVFNHEPDVIFWIDDKPYSVKSASKK